MDESKKAICCDSCIHELVCKYKEQLKAFQEKIEDITIYEPSPKRKGEIEAVHLKELSWIDAMVFCNNYLKAENGIKAQKARFYENDKSLAVCKNTTADAVRSIEIKNCKAKKE